MKYTLIIVALVVVLGLGYYFMTSGSSGTPTYTPPATDNQAATTPTPAAPAQTTLTPTPTPPVTKTPAAPASSSMTVSIKNFAFNPVTLTVKSGTKVTWTNNDTAPHTVTSDSGDLLKSPTLAPGQSFSFTFTAPGSVSYHCAIHTMMKGTISVTN